MENKGNRLLAPVRSAIKKYGRKRFMVLFLGSLLAFATLWVMDPSNPTLQGVLQEGTWFFVTVGLLSKTFVYLALLHIGRKILFDYIDLGDIYDKVMNDNDSSFGAGLFMVGIGSFAIAIAIVIAVAALAT